MGRPVEAHTPVEVWCDSTRRWVGGFEVSEFQENGWVRVRRSGSGPLPEPLRPELVRQARPGRQPWQVAMASRRLKRLR